MDSNLFLVLWFLPLLFLMFLMLLRQKMFADRVLSYRTKDLKEPITFYVQIQNEKFLSEFEEMLKRMLADGVIVSFGYVKKGSV